MRAATGLGAVAAGAIAAALLVGTGTTPSTPDVCNVTRPDAVITPALLTSGLPCKAVIIPPITIEGIQHGFDFYSWLTFLALNSPQDGKTTIGRGPGANGDAPTIWEGWRDIDSIMRSGGADPGPWDATQPIPDVCKKQFQPGLPIVSMVGKTPNVLSAVSQPFKTGPLIDQNGAYTRYDILVNRTMFDYIVAHHLYSKSGQKAFSDTVSFPEGSINPKAPVVRNTTTGVLGAIMVKVAWKIMGANDDASHFHTTTALIHTKPVSGTNIKIKESCTKAKLGLVGLHIAHKIQGDPQWIWSSYEHIDNVPSQNDVNAGHLLAHYNYFDPSCKTCRINDPPPRPWDPNIQPFPKGYKSQITRIIPIGDASDQITKAFHAILKGTVWENYVLVSTQWPTAAKSTTDPTGAPAPHFMANTTAETYIQGTVPQSSSGCIQCHNHAAMTTTKFSDFTYILENAQ